MTMTAMNDRTRREAGFSLIELLVVVAIILVVAAVAIPNMMQGMRYVRLHSSGTDAAGVIQNARMRAIRDNTNYAVLNAPALGGNGTMIYVDINNDGQYQPTEPSAKLDSTIALNPASVGNAAIASLQNLMLAGVAGAAGYPIQVSTGTQTNPPMFNDRGVPCKQAAGLGAGPGLITSCPVTSPGPPAGLPYGYIYILQSANLPNDGWAAVTVSPGGRIRTWYYTPNAPFWR